MDDVTVKNVEEMVSRAQKAQAAVNAITETRNSNPEPLRRVLIGTPSLGLVRMEWHNAMSGLVIPVNWSNSASTPLGWLVADAQNLLVQQALRDKFLWLLLLEDDVMPPADLFLKFERHMEEATAPIVSGLYHVKGPSWRKEPMVYRGRGNGPFTDWKAGDRVWADGVPTGCLLIHHSILQALSDVVEPYTLKPIGDTITLPRVFYTPREAISDMGANTYQKVMGTSDLQFCQDVITKDILKQAGWPEVARRKYPFLVDTAIACGHIDRSTGQVW